MTTVAHLRVPIGEELDFVIGTAEGMEGEISVQVLTDNSGMIHVIVKDKAGEGATLLNFPPIHSNHDGEFFDPDCA